MRARGWLILALWGVLGFLLLSLIGVAGLLLVKMDFFTGKELTDEETKSLWAFVGVALGAVVTLIGALLTEQHNRRTTALTREAGERESLAKKAQAALDKQAEKRLSLDTVAKLLELITDDGGYAKPARVGGAIATMVELEGGTVALRILGDLWAAEAVDTATAVWLLDHVLSAGRPEDEQEEAAYLLYANVSKLVPAEGDPDQDWNHWPALLRDSWPSTLSSTAKNALLVMVLKLLLVREPKYWKERAGNYPVSVLYWALEDDEYRPNAAFVLATFLDLGILGDLDADPGEARAGEIRSWAESFAPLPWFRQLLEQFGPWARGQAVSMVSPAPSLPSTTSEPQSQHG